MIEFIDFNFLPLAAGFLGGIGKALFGGSKTGGGSVDTTSIPGIFEQGGPGTEIANTLRGKANERFDFSLDPFQIPSSTPSFNIEDLIGGIESGQALQSELFNPSFGVNESEQALLDEVTEQFLGNQALRNLKATGGGFAETLAPELVKFRQDRIDNLQNAFNTDVNALLSGTLEQRDQETRERAADIQAGLTGRGQDIAADFQAFDQGINTLLALMDASRPTPIVRQGSTSRSTGIFPALGSVSGFFGKDKLFDF